MDDRRDTPTDDFRDMGASGEPVAGGGPERDLGGDLPGTNEVSGGGDRMSGRPNDLPAEEEAAGEQPREAPGSGAPTGGMRE